MGRFLLIARLAARDLRRRPAEAALLLLAITAATATLTLGLVLHGVASDPYQRTREATAGPDVVASVSPDPVQNQPADRASLEALTDAAGVVDHSGPYPVTGAVLEARGQLATAQVEGRDPEGAAVDQPELTQGSWVGDGGAVIEAAFADALGVRAGDQITLNGRSFHVVGVAVTAAVPPYPTMSPTGTADNPPQYCVPYPDPCAQQWEARGDPSPEVRAAWRRSDAEHPGLVWLTQSDARSVVPEGESPSYVLNLKLDDPAEASAFVNTYLPPGRSPDVVGADGPSFQPGSRSATRSPPIWSETSKKSCSSAAGCSPCSPWPASRCWSEAAWPTRPDASDCSRPSVAHRAWSQPCCSPNTWSWRCSRPRLG